MPTPGRVVWLAALTCALATSFVAPAVAPAAGEPNLSEAIASYREHTWRWQRLVGRPRTLTPRLPAPEAEEAYGQWVLAVWKARAARWRLKVLNPPRRSAWLCIHRREGPWDANTGNGYYGGLQMDITFQRMYGRFLLRQKGRAHRWSPLEQIWVAERAYRSGRGFRPWPNTARRCGLL